MTCPVCGTPTVAGARYCFACGTALVGPGTAENETERRVVTVLFGDLSEFTSWAEDLDPERVGGVTDRVLATLTAAVSEFGGAVDKLTGDGLMAVFGAPVAHEDDAERAVRAAWRMQTAVRRLVAEEGGGGRRLGLRVGLNTGTVLAGVQAHLSYTVVGDTVNTAARLSDAAGVGAVYAGRDTALTTMAIASWRALEPLRLKGKREPVTAFELVGLRPAGAVRLGLGAEAPFVGREAELGLLIGRCLDVVDSRSPRAVMVPGEAGVGKTRLAQELARFAGELPQARVLWGRVAPYGEGRDLAAVAEMVRTACGIHEHDDAAAARERVSRTVARLDLPAYGGAVPQAMAEQLGALLGLEDPTPALPRDAATPGRLVGGDQVRDAVGALFTALAADGPLVLVLDDLHWATPGMLRGLLDVAAGTSGPVLLLGLGRPDMLGPGADSPWWEGLPAVELLPVLPLEETAAERLLRSYLGADDRARAATSLDSQVRDALLSRAQGNPFFLAELLHLLVDRGALRREAQGWVLAAEVPDELLPAGVQSVLAARIDGLDGPAKGVLRDASVIGLRMTLPELAVVGRASGHGDPAVVLAAVHTLVERRLLESELDEGSYRFGHTLVRDVAYAGLAKAERARRHAAAAAYTPRAATASSTEADAVMAAHGEQALRLAEEMGLPEGDPAWQARSVAFAALARLVAAALGRDDNPAAERLARRALSLVAKGPGAPMPIELVIPLRVSHAQALAALLRLEEAEEQLGPALSAAEDGLRAAAFVVLGHVRRRRGDLSGAREALVCALAAAGSAGQDRVSGEALRQLGLLDYFDGRLKSAEDRFRSAHELAVQVGDSRGAGWALQHLAWSATTRGDYDLADGTLEAAADVFSLLEDSGGLSWVAGTEGFVRLLQGRLSEARELAGSVLPLGEARGERWGVAALLTIDALAAAELGDLGTAQEEAEQARVRFVDLGDVWGQALALTAAGVAARGADRPAEALSLLTRAASLSEVGRFPMTQSLALIVSGYCHLDRGEVDDADACARAASAVLAGLDLEPHAGLGAAVLSAQILRARGDVAGALAALDAALALADEPALLFPRRQALAHRAGMLLQLGRAPEALITAELAVATPGQDVRSEVLSLRALGTALRALGDEERATSVYRKALAVATSTGQRSEIAATERALAGTAPRSGDAG